MTQISSLHQANRVLARYIPAVKEITGKDITLDRMLPLMKLLGNSEAKLKIIHIAGTSGKTSTAYYIASLLQASGQKVGLTVSPHIESVAERVQINLKPLGEAEFCNNLSRFLELIEHADPQPTYFELLVAFAYWYFEKTGVDYAVIETGLGGLHDATNVAGRPDKICVITDIGLDHTKVLGSTITKITAQKAGIIHARNNVFCYKQSRTVMTVLADTVTSMQARLHIVLPATSLELSKALPLFQRRNWHLAQSVYKFIDKRDRLPDLTQHQLASSMAVRIPARMEIVRYKKKTIIMDGAHNPQKLRALLASIRHSYPDQTIAILAGFVQSRRPRLYGNLRILLPVAGHLIVTSFMPGQEMHAKSAEPSKITKYCQELGFNKWEIEPNNKEAVQKLLQRPEPVLLITGSFYLLQYIRPIIMSLHD